MGLSEKGDIMPERRPRL
jgi:NAD(P)-dependent dehydrogenase (short-subunit alcohol dehydrogenase family)